MRVSVEEEKPLFTPITLNITFTNQDEIDEFYAIFNHTKICSCSRKLANVSPNLERY